MWQVTLSVDAAGRIQGDGHPIKRKKPILHGRKTSTAAVEVKEAELKEATDIDMAEVEMPELDRATCLVQCSFRTFWEMWVTKRKRLST